MEQIIKDEQLFAALLSNNLIMVKRFRHNKEIIVGEGILKEYSPFFVKLDNEYYLRKRNLFYVI
ncbi:hypothetical protein [Paenibacillus alvei]|uniref:hypothetical protein n=1 Tax=Paenibacillus alvei TaxID=44250 RepID=UPI0003864999|nr:hypothetical protein [Paenibacillus alvei]EPY11277.1 hypothetical protein PAAL66ix_18979 [Paenibacillus alvei A6-6i-x]